MEKNHIIELLPEYLDSTLSEIQKKAVAEHLAECSICSQQYQELQELLKAIKDEATTAPSDALRSNFFGAIELEKQQSQGIHTLQPTLTERKSSWANTLLKVAASIALLVGSFIMGKKQQEQVSNKEIAQLSDESLSLKQTAMISLMGNESASKRIQGVNFIDEFNEPDEAIVNALVDRMLNDENTNVRRTAVEVLSEYTASETVKSGFISALKTEKDPGIQINIIQVLGKIQEKKAVSAMQFLLKQKDTQPYVKEELEAIIPTII